MKSYELVIIGGGPAGVSAGVYAARKKINTLLITEEFGGQSAVSSDIENWIGTKHVTGFEFTQMLKGHLEAQEDDSLTIMEGDRVEKVNEQGGMLVIKTDEGEEFSAKWLLLASGSHRRKLGVPGEAELEGRGVAYCATCDAPLFKDKHVAVVGGGNAGVEAVVDLLSYASKVTLLVRSDRMKGDPVTQEEIEGNENVEIIYHANTKEIVGDKTVEGLKYEDTEAGEMKDLEVQGVFVEIGSIPNSDLVADLVERNEGNEVVVDHKTQETSHSRIWAVGDVSDVLYKQNNISAGDAVKAVLNINERKMKSKG